MDGQGGQTRKGKLPELKAGVYIWNAFQRLGNASVTFSVQPLAWAEIDAYSRNSDGWIGSWEVGVIHDMSVAYVDGYRSGKDPLAIPPWEME